MLGLKCLKEIAKFAFFSELAALPACYHGDTFGLSKYIIHKESDFINDS